MSQEDFWERAKKLPPERLAELQETNKRLHEQAAARRAKNTERPWYFVADGKVTGMTELKHSVQPVFPKDEKPK